MAADREKERGDASIGDGQQQGRGGIVEEMGVVDEQRGCRTEVATSKDRHELGDGGCRAAGQQMAHRAERDGCRRGGRHYPHHGAIATERGGGVTCEAGLADAGESGDDAAPACKCRQDGPQLLVATEQPAREVSRCSSIRRAKAEVTPRHCRSARAPLVQPRSRRASTRRSPGAVGQPGPGRRACGRSGCGSCPCR